MSVIFRKVIEAQCASQFSWKKCQNKAKGWFSSQHFRKKKIKYILPENVTILTLSMCTLIEPFLKWKSSHWAWHTVPMSKSVIHAKIRYLARFNIHLFLSEFRVFFHSFSWWHEQPEKNVSIFEAILLKYIIKINGAFLNQLQTIVLKTETIRELFFKKRRKKNR